MSNILCNECHTKQEEDSIFCGYCGDQLKHYNHKENATYEYDQEMELVTIKRKYEVHPPKQLTPQEKWSRIEYEAIKRATGMWRMK